MCVCVCVLQFSELQADSEDVQRSVQQLKKKCQKMTAELQDTKLHLEGLQSRNHELEKKQRKSVPISCSPPTAHPVFHHQHHQHQHGHHHCIITQFHMTHPPPLASLSLPGTDTRTHSVER